MSDDEHDTNNPECPHCKDATERSNALRKRLLAQLQEWEVPPDHAACAALLWLASQCIDGQNPEALAWFTGLAVSLAAGKPVEMRVLELPKPPQPTSH